MVKHLLLLCALFCTPVFCFSQKFTGKVFSGEEPVAGAKITITNTLLVAYSDEKGMFTMQGVDAGNTTYEIIVAAKGYKTYMVKTVVVPDLLMLVSLEQEENLIDEIEILSIRANHYSAQSYTDLSKEKIRENNLGQDMPYILNQTPSVVVTSDAGTGVGYTGMRIRGSDATRINVTINGMPLNDAESQGTYWVDLPDFASSADQIQIQRGVGTSTNGSGAFGASINVNTNQLKSKAYAELHNSFGSFNTQRHTVSFGTGLLNNKFTFDGRLSSIISDGYIDRASSDLKSFYTSIAYVGKKSNLRFNVFSGKEKTYQAWYGVYQDSLKTNRTFNPYSYKNQTDNYWQTHYQFFWNTKITSKFYTSLALYTTKGKGYYEELKESESFSAYGLNDVIVGSDTISSTDLVRRRWLDNQLLGGNFSLNYDGKKFKSILGGGYNTYFGDHYGEIIWAQYSSNSSLDQKYYSDDATKKDMNVFSKNTYSFTNKFSAYLDLQMRNVNYNFVGLDDVFNISEQKIKYTFFNPKVGLTVDLNNRNNFYASFGIGNREPNRDDFVNSTPQNWPKPEQMQDLEVGYNFNGQRFSIASNVYYMNYKDQLVLTGRINDVGSYIRENVAKSFRRGIELQTRYMPIKLLEWNANLTISENKTGKYTEYVDTYDTLGGFSQTEVDHENTSIAFSPSVIAGSEFKFNLINKTATASKKTNGGSVVLDEQIKKGAGHKLSLSFISKYVGKQYLDNTSNEERKLEAYFTQDIRLRYEMKTKSNYTVAVYFQAINLLNKLYASNGYVYPYYYGTQLNNDKYYYPQAGINFLGGISFIF